jgi:two-component system cell cycle sensor histidine kinase/response regulator CckA
MNSSHIRSLIQCYGLALAVFVIVIGVAVAFERIELRLNLTILVVAGIVIVSWFGGRGPGILLAAGFQIVTMLFNPIKPDDSYFRYAFSHISVFAIIVMIVWLITGRRSSERTLKKQAELFRTTLSSIGDAVIATDAEGRVTFMNPAAERLTRWTSGEAQGRKLAEVYNVRSEKDGEPLSDLFERIRKERRVVVFDKNTNLIDRQGSELPIMDSGAPIIDDEQQFQGAVVVFQDVSERRRAERTLIETEHLLHQSQKLEAIGTMTGGIAHDFNNLLTAVLGYKELAVRRLGPDPHAALECLDNIGKAGTRAAELTKKLLAFSRRQKLDRRVIDLNESIAEILGLLSRVIGADIELVFNRAEELQPVYADPVQIEQVVMNLCVNARDAMPRGGRLVIETSATELDEFYCRRHPNCTPGKYTLIVVSDTGEGIDAETLERIFDPFFTTKDVNKGTGLGLSTVYGIVRQHGGMINVYSEPGRGTTFKVLLPVVQDKIDSEIHRTDDAVSKTGTETILVAEDEQALQVLAEDVLTSLGYSVLLASDGHEALELFKANLGKIDLCLFDVVMPGIGGPEAYEQIREMGGSMPVIFMTGYSPEILEGPYGRYSDSAGINGATVIQKPYTLSTLGREVRSVLDAVREE